MPAMRDDGPSPDDIRRFSHETAYCPECGAEIWDAAPACPSCGHMLPDGPGRYGPMQVSLNRKVAIVVALAALIGFLLLVL